MKTEMLNRITKAVHEAMKEGYYPSEDILNGPRMRVVPIKLKYLIASGCKDIHMNSDIKGKETFNIAIA